VLHQGRIAEMKTGEGKTLVATMPAYLNALTGKGVHIVTVNDYLAKRDSEWMGGIFRFLGLSVGLIVHGLTAEERKKAYNADVTYGTNNEFGFDYLRDNMALRREEMVQRPLHYAIVDEVDSILIDEARTPLIISGQADKPTDLYYKIARVIPKLKKDKDYQVDEKLHTVALTEEGTRKVEELLGVQNLSDEENLELAHHVYQGLRAHALMKRDRDYVVKDGQVIIVDEFTGRLMFGRRFSEGLHQAIEAKEGVRIERESQTLATITFQNYFRMYEKLLTATRFGFPIEYVPVFAICAMAGTLASSVKAPITAILLTAEMSGSLVHTLPVAACAFIGLLVSDILKIDPIYETLLQRFIDRNGTTMTANRRGGIVEVPVEFGCEVVGKAIRDVQWPQGILIVAIRRGAKELVPQGSTVIVPGDYLIALCPQGREHEAKEAMRKLCLVQKEN